MGFSRGRTRNIEIFGGSPALEIHSALLPARRCSGISLPAAQTPCYFLGLIYGGGEELTIAFSCKCASSGMFMGNSMVNKCHLMT